MGEQGEGKVRVVCSEGSMLGRWKRWKDSDMARLERLGGSNVASWKRRREVCDEVAKWERCEGSEVSRWVRWQSHEGARWEVPGSIREWATHDES